MSQHPAPVFPDVAFPGRERLVAAIDAALAAGDAHAVTATLRTAMCRLIRDPAVELPACVHAPVEGHYARRELYRSPAHGYSVVAMTWAPGQGTPIHDHDGLWCVEGIWRGALEITQYELLDSAGDRARFRAAGGMQAGTGSAGSLIPPHEYHTIHNASPDAVAVSLHVYQAPIEHCARYRPLDDDWYQRFDDALPADATD
ncbi:MULTISPECIES: cysteine dioxygenase family protein [Luteimonas]|uniref:Cysteine dioxygenase n=1 Tax=Luteimonas chenhongjianii TaxID=2006110 RepID=A0A290XFZ3_9GAMM|nr:MULTISPECIES: cysteine dioxygenase family protein [Luteimonas]ATD68009.1 cysteine dioxygenase [Luteimonas chenhongjianii]RPD88328.1 cysteine dioxygenase [Luteimonas sp. 100069]